VEFRLTELRRSLDADLLWTRASIPGLFRSVALANIEEDFARWRTNLILLGAQLASLTEGLAQCLQRGIGTLAAGYTKYEHDYHEQDPAAVLWLREFCASYGVDLSLPVYDYTSADQVKYALLNFGISTKSLEAVSLFGDTFSPASPEAITQYLDAKADTCRSYIGLKTTGTDEEPIERVTSRPYIHKIGAAIVRNGRILVVRKHSSTDTFIIPGGKPEGSESHEQTLARELDEELGAHMTSSRYIGSFEDVAEFEDVPIRMDVYRVEIAGEPRPGSEIAELRWVRRDYSEDHVRIGSVLAMFVIPRMADEGLM
jgi:8-oxo-dGTP pyrophosphatase MutT (NUDIX family)